MPRLRRQGMGDAMTGDRWFDGDYSDTYVGIGWWPKAEFAAWAASDGECTPTRRDVHWRWARWIDDERFVYCHWWNLGAFRLTVLCPFRANWREALRAKYRETVNEKREDER